MKNSVSNTDAKGKWEDWVCQSLINSEDPINSQAQKMEKEIFLIKPNLKAKCNYINV